MKTTQYSKTGFVAGTENSFNIFSNRGKATPARHAIKGCLAAALVVFLGLSLSPVVCRAEHLDTDAPGTEVLTRGPVHEAFAGMVTFNPEPGVVVIKAPPAVIEELPPEERPEGDNVSWIPGYWAWDDERTDFLWVSGTWRALPPGREWMAGYWGQTSRGYQWTSGYWADASARETTYLPAPPATVEVGPNIAAPSDDYGWTPGCWVWYSGRYAWTPGYWAQGRADWDWMPSHYVWTPRGYIFVGGYWDYTVARRGVLFAPVYFESGVYARRDYYYSPRIVINLDVFNDHLFLRPSYGHYYFGDYYAPSYHSGGFYASFSFYSGRHGYDPFYSHQRWEHRSDREWEHHVEASYDYRREHEAARPPRTWAAQANITQVNINQVNNTQVNNNQVTINQVNNNAGAADTRRSRLPVAMPITQLATRKDSPVRFQTVAKEERQQLVQRGQEVQKSREERRTLETKAVATTSLPGRTVEPARVKLSRSPIVAKSASQLGRNQAPPEVPRAPKLDLKRQPQSEPAGRQPALERSNPQSQPQPRQLEPEKRPTPGRNGATPRERQVQPAAPERRSVEPQAPPPRASQPRTNGQEKKAQQDTERRANDAAVKAQEDSQRNAQGQEKKAQQESEQRTRDAAVKARNESQRNAQAQERKTQQQDSERRANDAAVKAQQESQQRTRDAAVKARDESQRNANASEKKAQQDSERRANDAAVKAQQDSQRNTRESEQKAQQQSQQRARDSAAKARDESQRNASAPDRSAPRASEPPARYKPAPSEKGAAQLLRKESRQKNDKERAPKE